MLVRTVVKILYSNMFWYGMEGLYYAGCIIYLHHKTLKFITCYKMLYAEKNNLPETLLNKKLLSCYIFVSYRPWGSLEMYRRVSIRRDRTAVVGVDGSVRALAGCVYTERTAERGLLAAERAALDQAHTSPPL